MLGSLDAVKLGCCYQLAALLYLATDPRRQSSADMAEDHHQCPTGNENHYLQTYFLAILTTVAFNTSKNVFKRCLLDTHLVLLDISTL